MTRPTTTFALALLAALAPLAGCISGDAPAAQADALDPASLVSQPIYEGLLAEHAPIDSFDGTTIDAYVFRPETDEPVPVIINFSPYWSNLAPPVATGGDAFSRYLIDHYVPRGYAVALVSARGTGLSEGCFTIGGPDEVRDSDVVATFFGTQPWSNGNVTATGKSYDGTIANGLITTGNPHVKTIVPVSGISELYLYNHFDGVTIENGLLVGNHFNAIYVAAVSLSQGVNPYTAFYGVSADAVATYALTPTRFCEESVDVQTEGARSSVTGDYTPYWQARNYSALLPDEVPSVFLIHGLQDWNVQPSHVFPFVDEVRARGAPVKMWLGQWAHDYPTRDDWNQTMLRWFDHFLKGIDTGILDEPLVQVQGTDGLWRDEPQWPPARHERLVLHPTEGGKLLDDGAPGTGSGWWIDRSDGGRLVYEMTLAEDLRLVGAPTLFATVESADMDDATIVAVLRLDGEIIDEGALDLAHRDSLATRTPMTPGERYDVRVRFFPQDTLLPAGSTLTLEIASTSPGPARFAPVHTGATMTLHHGEGTSLVLPVIPAADVTPEARQPEDVGCWAC